MTHHKKLPYHNADPISADLELDKLKAAFLELEQGRNLEAASKHACKATQGTLAALNDEKWRLGGTSSVLRGHAVCAESLIEKILNHKMAVLDKLPDQKVFFQNMEARLNDIQRKFLNK